MAQSHTANPQLSNDKLAKEIGNIYDKSVSLLSLCLQADPALVHDGKVVSVSSRIDTAVAVAEGDPISTDTDMSVVQTDMIGTKSRNHVILSNEILEDSMESFRLTLLEEVAQSHKRYSDAYIANLIQSAALIPDVNVASTSALTLLDIHAACIAVNFNGILPDLFCSQEVYFALKDKEVEAGLLSEAGSVAGLRWVPVSIGPASASGDLVAFVGDPKDHFVVADHKLRVALDSQSSAANALHDQSSLFSNHRFSVGQYQSVGTGLAKITIV